MKAANRPRFDIDALRGLAGEKVFARGEEYFSGGQVQIITLEPPDSGVGISRPPPYLSLADDPSCRSLAFAPDFSFHQFPLQLAALHRSEAMVAARHAVDWGANLFPSFGVYAR